MNQCTVLGLTDAVARQAPGDREEQCPCGDFSAALPAGLSSGLVA